MGSKQQRDKEGSNKAIKALVLGRSSNGHLNSGRRTAVGATSRRLPCSEIIRLASRTIRLGAMHGALQQNKQIKINVVPEKKKEEEKMVHTSRKFSSLSNDSATPLISRPHWPVCNNLWLI
jgi:hypothetical protein